MRKAGGEKGCLGPPQNPRPHAQNPPFPPRRVQELKLEEQQWQLDQKLRWYMEKEGKRPCGMGGSGARLGTPPTSAPLQPAAPAEALKTAEDCVAEKETLAQLLDVVNKRNALIQMQEEKRLSELHA